MEKEVSKKPLLRITIEVSTPNCEEANNQTSKNPIDSLMQAISGDFNEFIERVLGVNSNVDLSEHTDFLQSIPQRMAEGKSIEEITSEFLDTIGIKIQSPEAEQEKVSEVTTLEERLISKIEEEFLVFHQSIMDTPDPDHQLRLKKFLNGLAREVVKGQSRFEWSFKKVAEWTPAR